MYVKDVADRYGFELSAFYGFLAANNWVVFTGGLDGYDEIDDEKVPQIVEAYSRINEEQKQKEEERKRQEEAFNIAAQNMLLSTCSSIDGYKAVAQYGLVYGECVFKASLPDRISASIDDLINTFMISEREMTGIGSLLKTARKYATRLMIREAYDLGANAIIGIDNESSAGTGGIIHITICGTAVKMIPADLPTIGL